MGQVERFAGLCCAAAYSYQPWTLSVKVPEAIPVALVAISSLISRIFLHFQDLSSSQNLLHLLSGLQSPCFPNLNNLCAEVQDIVSLLLGEVLLFLSVNSGVINILKQPVSIAASKYPRTV